MANPVLHPMIDRGFPKSSGPCAGGKLYCHCPSDKVEVTVRGDLAHNHACGCSKCWKPKGAFFSIVGVVPDGNLQVTAHEEKLAIVDAEAAIRRHACRRCGVHLYGDIVIDHPFKGLSFIHVELSPEKGWQAPQFAGFVSSIIEQGYDPNAMEVVRGKFASLGLESYDVLSPSLMDAIATHNGKKSGALTT